MKTTVAQPNAPHPATVAQPKAPHPATVVRPIAPHSATLARSGETHPATSLQPRNIRPASTAGPLPRHPATVAQPKAPHPATVAQPKAPHPATVVRPIVPHPAATAHAALRGAAMGSGTVQGKLDSVTRRVIDEESESWKALLKGNEYTKLDIKKISNEEVYVEFLTEEFRRLLAIDRELDQYFSPSTRQKRRNRIKDRIERSYYTILNFAEDKLDEANETYESNLNKGVEIVEAFKDGTDRKHKESGKAIKSGATLVKYEKEELLPPLIATRYGAHIKWVTETKFVNDVMARFAQGRAPRPALSTEEVARLATEKGRINTQLGIWRNVASNAVGVNENGTWGTSSGGAGNGFQISQVNRAVWTALRRWWIKKANAFVTPSDTSNYSLKMDRAVENDNLSARFNYHINVSNT